MRVEESSGELLVVNLFPMGGIVIVGTIMRFELYANLGMYRM
jgi:hypothetical protein